MSRSPTRCPSLRLHGSHHGALGPSVPPRATASRWPRCHLVPGWIITGQRPVWWPQVPRQWQRMGCLSISACHSARGTWWLAQPYWGLPMSPLRSGALRPGLGGVPRVVGGALAGWVVVAWRGTGPGGGWASRAGPSSTASGRATTPGVDAPGPVWAYVFLKEHETGVSERCQEPPTGIGVSSWIATARHSPRSQGGVSISALTSCTTNTRLRSTLPTSDRWPAFHHR